MLNKAMIIGRLGQDPELKYTQSGMPICRFSVATDESYTDQSGQKQQRTEWHRIVTFQKQAENCANYLTKGSLVFVEGSITTNKWTDKNGQDRYTTEIKGQRVQFLSFKNGENQTQRGQNQAENNDGLGNPFPADSGGMDDVPFS